MNIVQLTPFFHPVIGGVESHVYNLSKELVKRGHKVHVLTTAVSRVGSSQMLTEDFIDGIYVKRFPVWFSFGMFAKFWPGFISNLLRQEEIDLIHAHGYRHPHSTLSIFISRIKKKPCVLTSHSPFHPSKARGKLQRRLVAFYDSSLGPMLTRNFDGVIALHPGELHKLLKLGVQRNKLWIIPNGVDELNFAEANGDQFKEQFGIKSRYILYVGRLHETKGLGFLIKAFKFAVKRSQLDISLVIVGSGSKFYEWNLKKIVRKLNLRERVLFTGHISEELKMSAYAGCECVILPSIYEPFGIVLLEAMAHGKPVVSTMNGGPLYIIKDGKNGFLVRYGDLDGLASKIILLLEDSRLNVELGRTAKLSSLQYRWGNITDQVEDVYKKLTRSNAVDKK